MEVAIVRFEAPLMSFGAPIVDNRGEIQPFPALSMLTGMIGNALGYEHREFDRLQRLQESLRYASREDRQGDKIEDYQTVDLGQDFMDDSRGWTTDGELEERAGASGGGTHIRRREYWADAVHTVAVTLDSDAGPTLAEVTEALESPERPLFIGRKTCLPAGELFDGTFEAPDLRSALERAPLHNRADEGPRYRAWWPVEPGADEGQMSRPVTDRRDWSNQIHVGERWIAQGAVEIESSEEE